MAIWITSDLHFCHDCEYLYEPRGFTSVDEMNAAIVTRINAVVNEDDDLWILGDLMVNNTDEGIEYMKLLKGHLHIIFGNHDTDMRIEKYKKALSNATFYGFGARIEYKDYHFFLSHYPTLIQNYDSELSLKNKTINLCGHSHTKRWNADMDKGLIFHCEADTNSCYPWNLDTIIEKIK